MKTYMSDKDWMFTELVGTRFPTDPDGRPSLEAVEQADFEVAATLDERTAPPDEDVVMRDTYLPQYAKGKAWTVFPPVKGLLGTEAELPGSIIYDPR